MMHITFIGIMSIKYTMYKIEVHETGYEIYQSTKLQYHLNFTLYMRIHVEIIFACDAL